MKLSSSSRYRRLVFAGMLLAVFSFGKPGLLTLSAAPTNAPAPATAPAGANIEMDKETGKPVVTTPSGLKYVDLVVGTGPAVKTRDQVTVNYVGKLIDGTEFDASAKHGGT